MNKEINIKQQTVIQQEKIVEVRDSGVHNKGVFALKNIPQNTKIIEYRGDVISKKEADKRLDETYVQYKKNPKDYAATYIFELDDEHDLDGNTPDNDAKYINHSCNPNCYFEIKKDHIDIYAKRDIQEGEELSYNYGFDFDEEYKEHPCRCGSINCVGYIVAEEDWPLLKERLEKDKLLK